jgi:hypothetical protein
MLVFVAPLVGEPFAIAWASFLETSWKSKFTFGKSRSNEGENRKNFSTPVGARGDADQ